MRLIASRRASEHVRVELPRGRAQAIAADEIQHPRRGDGSQHRGDSQRDHQFEHGESEVASRRQRHGYAFGAKNVSTTGRRTNPAGRTRESARPATASELRLGFCMGGPPISAPVTQQEPCRVPTAPDGADERQARRPQRMATDDFRPGGTPTAVAYKMCSVTPGGACDVERRRPRRRSSRAADVGIAGDAGGNAAPGAWRP